MAYDPDLSSARFPMELLPESARNYYTPVGYDKEPELKIEIPVPRNVILRQVSTGAKQGQWVNGEIDYIAKTFLELAKSFQRNLPGHESYLDASGAVTRDYVLVNLGQDTGIRLGTGIKLGNIILPEMRIAREGYQYRERFALPVFADIPHEDIGILNFDANAKTLQSSGGLRKEFETGNGACSSLNDSYSAFRQVPNLPEFFHEINPKDLYVIKTWMTSRSSFTSLSRIPGTDVFALCEHCCDITKYTTANFENLINDGRSDPEWETEVKGFFGSDPRLLTEDGQEELITRTFDDIVRRFRAILPSVTIHELSKMERAREWTSRHFEKTSIYKGVSQRHNPIASLFDNAGVGPGLAHAFTLAVRSQTVISSDYMPRLIRAGCMMPDPRDILNQSALLHHINAEERACKVA